MEQAAGIFDQLKIQLGKNGWRLDDANLWIASIEIDNKTTLITHNTKYFKQLSEIHPEN